MKRIIVAIALIAFSSPLFAGGSSSKPLDGAYPIVLAHGILGFDDTSGLAGGLVKYWGGAGKVDVSTIRTKYEHLLERGEEVVWYGGSVDPKDRHAILMHQKLADDKYVVTFTDSHEKEIDSEELIQLMARMLKKKAK